MSGRPHVLVLSGWSDGPLVPLCATFPHVKFVKVTIPTPPSGCRWLCNPFLLVLLGIIGGTPAALRFVSNFGLSSATQVGAQFSLLLFILLALRATIARVVRYAINDGIDKTMKAISQFHPVAIVGFSWGGGVLWEMLTNKLTNKIVKLVPCLLLAPTVSAMSYASLTGISTCTFEETGRVAIVCGDADPFCPLSQKTIMVQCKGLTYYGVNDDHVLLEANTRALTAKILREYLSQAHTS